MAFIDAAARSALDNLLCLLESGDDGNAFSKDYAEEIAAARNRLRPEA